MNTYVASVKIGTLLISALTVQGAPVVVQQLSNGSTQISFTGALGAVTVETAKTQTIPVTETVTLENTVRVARKALTTLKKSALKPPSRGAFCDEVARR